MKGSEYMQLLETAWQRPLSEGEQARLEAYFAAHPEVREDWMLEAGLSRVLHDLPDTPLASNFTAQVLRTVERDQAVTNRPAKAVSWRSWLSLGWRRIVTLGAAVGCAALMAYQYSRMSDRAELAQSVAKVTSVATMPSLEVLQDFEAINRLSQVSSGVDLDLLAGVQ
ncbi:MAG: hypothetical protein HYZ36_06770 [Pedosphaera parvula]|nr:hypothetical protein [Pedosphaera parvula]